MHAYAGHDHSSSISTGEHCSLWEAFKLLSNISLNICVQNNNIAHQRLK